MPPAARKPSPSRPRSSKGGKQRASTGGSKVGSGGSSGNLLTVEEIASTLSSSPHLAAAIIAVRDTPGMPMDRKMEAITRIVRQDGEPSSRQQQQTTHASLARPRQLSALEESQAAWRPTVAQKDGARAALREQLARAEQAETKRLSKPMGRMWASFGGEVIERTMLEDVDLVDARYLVSLHEHAGVVPRWQDLPACARINRSNVWRLWGWERQFSLGIVVLSYPWLDFDHPDKLGEQLARVVPILNVMLNFCGGEEFTVGVLWDYCSLPQPKRTPAEDARFSSGIRSLMQWFAQPYTHVLLMTGSLPTGGSYTNIRPYDARGWTEPERRTCAISKCVHCMWDIAGWDPSKLEGLERMQAYDVLRASLSRGLRPPPQSPTHFAKHLRQRVASGELSFSAESDLEMVIDMYKRGFVSIFDEYRDFDPEGFFAAWAAMGWGECEAKQIAAVLTYAAKVCKAKSAVSLRLEGNQFGKAGQQVIEHAIKGSKSFNEAIF